MFLICILRVWVEGRGGKVGCLKITWSWSPYYWSRLAMKIIWKSILSSHCLICDDKLGDSYELQGLSELANLHVLRYSDCLYEHQNVVRFTAVCTLWHGQTHSPYLLYNHDYQLPMVILSSRYKTRSSFWVISFGFLWFLWLYCGALKCGDLLPPHWHTCSGWSMWLK